MDSLTIDGAFRARDIAETFPQLELQEKVNKYILKNFGKVRCDKQHGILITWSFLGFLEYPKPTPYSYGASNVENMSDFWTTLVTA